MSAKLSVEDVLSNLEARAAFHRAQEALHAEHEIRHRDQRAFHAAELEKVLQNLEAFRTVASAAVELARPPGPKLLAELKLPPPGRLMAGRLVRLVAESMDLEEPFGPTAVAAEVNRYFADRLPEPVSQRAASDVLRRIAAEGGLQLVREGKPFHEALYKRKA
jgi:hypothetical protein